MLTYKKINNLEVIGYSDADFAGCVDSEVDIRLCLHTRKWSHIMEKLQAENNYIFNDVQKERNPSSNLAHDIFHPCMVLSIQVCLGIQHQHGNIFLQRHVKKLNIT
jgi:hypothetical protein